MLVVHSVTKRFGHQSILKEVDLTINANERVGLIGPNGSGKTTLLRIIAGEDAADEGAITFTQSGLQLGYLEQNLSIRDDLLLVDVLFPNTNQLDQVESELKQVSQRMSTARKENYPALENAYDLLLRKMERLSRPTDPGRTSATLEVLGLQDLPLSTPIAKLSGGQKTKLGLALELLKKPDLLLLDEPTNHLDIETLERLEDWLGAFHGAVLLVSHDRFFLDRCVNRILELDPRTHSIKSYSGNYSEYVAQRRTERDKQQAAYRDQVYEIRRMKQDIARLKEQSRKVERGTIDSSQRRYAKKVAKKARARAKRLTRYMQSEQRVEKPRDSWRMKIEFDDISKRGKNLLSVKDLSIGYPGKVCIVENINFEINVGARVVITGPNGVGKTTLLRTLAGHLDPLAGQIWRSQSIRMGYMTQEQELLDMELNALQSLRQIAAMNETDARSFLHYFLFTEDDSLRSISALSYGERARLELALLAAKKCDFLLLDEPINHLDIPSRTAFERTLKDLSITFMAVVHDRFFIEQFATELWTLNKDGIQRDHLKTFS